MSRRHVRKETQSSFPDDQKAKTLASAEFILLNKPNSSAFSSCCHLLCLLINMQIRKKKMDLTLKISNSCHTQIWLSLGRIYQLVKNLRAMQETWV